MPAMHVNNIETKKHNYEIHVYNVRRKGVRSNSVLCVECRSSVHKQCSSISGKLKNNIDFHCKICLEGLSPDQSFFLRERLR